MEGVLSWSSGKREKSCNLELVMNRGIVNCIYQMDDQCKYEMSVSDKSFLRELTYKSSSCVTSKQFTDHTRLDSGEFRILSVHRSNSFSESLLTFISCAVGRRAVSLKSLTNRIDVSISFCVAMLSFKNRMSLNNFNLR